MNTLLKRQEEKEWIIDFDLILPFELMLHWMLEEEEKPIEHLINYDNDLSIMIIYRFFKTITFAKPTTTISNEPKTC